MPKGGIRIGSGRPGWKPKAEDLYSLDIRKLKHDGLLIDATSVSLRWSRGGNVIGAATATYHASDCLTLSNASWVQRIDITSTECNYGGVRLWFVCPGCGARKAVLYLRNQEFRCRVCQSVAYTSQSEDYFGRLWRKQQKLQSKLIGGWSRPKGMHKRTHQKMFDSIVDCETRRDDAIALFAQKVFGIMQMR